MTNRVLLGNLNTSSPVSYGLRVSVPDIELETNVSFTTPDRIVAASGTPFADLVAGDYVRVANSTSNDGQYEVAGIISGGTQVETVEQAIVTESAGASKTCYQVYPVELVDSFSDFLFDSREAELGHTIKQGTVSITYSGTAGSATSERIYWDGASPGTAINYIPIVVFANVDGSGNVFRPSATDLWSTGDGINDLAIGDINYAHAVATDTWFEIRSRRVVDGTVKGGLANGTYTFAYYAMAVGNISVTAVGP